MNLIRRFTWLTVLSTSLLFVAAATFAVSEISKPPEKNAIIVQINGAIGPASADFVREAILEADPEVTGLIIIEMDTPGGLDKSMRRIIKAIIASPIPVATYVSPGGARAASAGTYILYASHIAAMAPGTNLGAATPVTIGMPKPNKPPEAGPPKEEKSADGEKSSMEKKMINDATAYIQSLAELHGRNVKWATKAVTEAKSLPAKKAMKIGVIDIVADDLEDLLLQANGRKVNINGKMQRIKTADLTLVRIIPTWKNKFLAVITSPDVAYILLLLGIYGLFFEFANPGFVLPGIVGGISLLLALYAFQMLPINYAGLGLIILGISFLSIEAFLPSFGVLGIGGTVAFALGSFLLLDSGVTGTHISYPIIIIFTLINAAFFLLVFTLAIRAFRKPVVTGQEQMAGGMAEALESFNKEGNVRIHGEIWTARSKVRVTKGESLKVVSIEGLILNVESSNKPPNKGKKIKESKK